MAGVLKGKDKHILSPSGMPMHKIKGDTAWGTTVLMENNHFIGFSGKTMYDKKNYIFGSSEYQPDYTPPHIIKNSVFQDVQKGGFAWFIQPPEAWANIKDCGNFPCTAPNNILYYFTGSDFKGMEPFDPSQKKADFQVVANNDGFGKHITQCTSYIDSMNAYHCSVPTLGVLHFDSNDEDRMDRSSQPITMTSKLHPGINNVLNSGMDHVWDGFYTGQLRATRFPAVVEAKKGEVINIQYTGTPPKKQTFQLYTEQKTDIGITIRIAYPNAGSYEILNKGQKVVENDYDKDIQEYSPIAGTKCGENRYLGVKNILEFYIMPFPECDIRIIPRDAIQTKVRMEWSLDQFFTKGGTTAFADRVSASLGIHASQIKVVSVYEGSLVVDYNMFPPEGASSTEAAAQLAAIESKQTEMFATGAMDLGAPVLDVQAGDVSVVSDGVLVAPGYKPVMLTVTASNKEFFQALMQSYEANIITIEDEEEAENIIREHIEEEQREFTPDVDIVIIDGTTNRPTTPIAPVVNPDLDEAEEEEDKAEPEVYIPPQEAKKGVKPLLLAVMIAFAFSMLVVLARIAYVCIKNKATDNEDMRMNELKKRQEFEMQVSKNHPDMVDRSSNASEFSTNRKLKRPEYEEQYDPMADFAIFVP